MKVVYRNEVLGDQGTKCVPVNVLPEPEQFIKVKSECSRALILFHELKLRELKAELEQMQHDCSHNYFNDEPGFMYDIRTCAVCGASMGLI